MKRRLIILGVFLAFGAAPSAAAEITITEEAIAPPVLRVPTGTRVDFVNRTQRNVHVEFGADPRQHEVVQVPLTGPIWAVFHRPGRHPYVVHIWADRLPTTRAGVVEVADNPEHPWKSSTCGTVVQGKCIEP